MRIALLPAGGDPFLLRYWLRHYEQTWAGEVDELRIVVCGARPETLDYIRAIVAAAPHASVSFLPRTDHGTVLRGLVDGVDPGDMLVLCEDDAFVRYAGVVTSRFAAIEAGEVDVIGTCRGSASAELIDRAEELYGPLPDTPSGETGLALFPCFLFARRTDIPDGIIGAQSWPAGTYLASLDYTCPGLMSADTFTEASWQMRAAGLRIRAESAYRSGTLRGDAPWFHVGSLSSGYGCSFMSEMDEDTWRSYVATIPPGDYDWHCRMSWWTRISDTTEGELPEYHARYAASLAEFMAEVGASPLIVASWRGRFDPLVTWRER